MLEQYGFHLSSKNVLYVCIYNSPFSHEMLIVLPDMRDGLPGVLESLTSNSDNFENVLNTFSYRQALVDLGLPVFSITGSTLNLESVLSSMGLASIFMQGKADLSEMDGSHNAYISKVIHKALIDVSKILLLFPKLLLN